MFIRGSVVRYVMLPRSEVDVGLLEDATRRGECLSRVLGLCAVPVFLVSRILRHHYFVCYWMLDGYTDVQLQRLPTKPERLVKARLNMLTYSAPDYERAHLSYTVYSYRHTPYLLFALRYDVMPLLRFLRTKTPAFLHFSTVPFYYMMNTLTAGEQEIRR